MDGWPTFDEWWAERSASLLERMPGVNPGLAKSMFHRCWQDSMYSEVKRRITARERQEADDLERERMERRDQMLAPDAEDES